MGFIMYLDNSILYIQMNMKYCCPICSRVNCTYSFAACKYQNRCIRKWPKKTIREKILNEYNQYLHSLEKIYKINRGEHTCINLHGEFNIWNQDKITIPFTDLQKNLIINYPINKHVKIYELYINPVNWRYYTSLKHRIHVTNRCNTYILKDVLHWRDLFEKLLKQYNKDKKMLRCGLKMLDIEILTHGHYGNRNKNKKLKGNEYVVSLCK